MEETKKQQVNVDFSNFPDLLKGLDKMVDEDGTDRSKFIRRLVRQELARRQQKSLPGLETESTRTKSAKKLQPA